MNKSALYMLPVAAMFALASCVPQRKYEELQNKYSDCQTSKSKSEESLFDCQNQLGTAAERNNKLKQDVVRLQLDSAECNAALDKTKRLHADKDKLQDEIIANGRAENLRIKEELNERTETLKNKEKELNDKEAALIDVQKRNNALETDLQKREARVKELEAVLKAKDSAVQALKNNLSNALLGFKDNGISVEVRNGKVYVSMEEKLLFKTASIVVDPKGEQALLELAKALNNQPDVTILVEGHTDDVPMKSGQIKDNWDLSVLRATSIVRILTEKGKVNPQRLMASGRGEFVPLDNSKTPEARTKNRRTEIILTPKLDELLKILGN